MCLLGAWNDTHIMLQVMKLTPAVSIALHLILSLAWDKSQAGITEVKEKRQDAPLWGPSLLKPYSFLWNVHSDFTARR